MENVLKDVAEHFLFPSTLFVSKEPHRIQTILGSCVAVCLYDERMKWGGMNHYMLPWWDGKGVPSPKYGDVAIERLVEQVIAQGSYPINLVAKIFGGASQHRVGDKGADIGARNFEMAESLLDQYQIKIVSKDLGGSRGRNILFDTKSGQVFMKYLQPLKGER